MARMRRASAIVGLSDLIKELAETYGIPQACAREYAVMAIQSEHVQNELRTAATAALTADAERVLELQGGKDAQ